MVSQHLPEHALKAKGMRSLCHVEYPLWRCLEWAGAWGRRSQAVQGVLYPLRWIFHGTPGLVRALLATGGRAARAGADLGQRTLCLDPR